MRTTQKAFAALTAAATLIGLAACGGGSDNASKGSTGDANKAELVFWGWDTGHTMTNLIKDFQKANPGITVKIQQHRYRLRHPDRTEQRHRRRQGRSGRGDA